MHKTIKKIQSAFIYLLIGILLLTGISFAIFQLPAVQGKLTNRVIEILESKLGNKILFDEVRFSGFTSIKFKALLVKDIGNDTLLYSNMVQIQAPGLITELILNENPAIKIRKLEMDSSYIRLYSDSTNTINLSFIVEKIKSGKDTSKAPKPFQIKEIDILNSRFALINHDTAYKESGIDFTRLKLNPFNLSVNNLRAYTDTVDLDIENLSFTDRSGFRVDKMSGDMHISNTQLHFKDVNIVTPFSDIKAEKIQFNFNTFKDFAQGDFYKKVVANYHLLPSKVNFMDIGYFASIFNNTYQEVLVSGVFSGPLINFKSKQLSLGFGETSKIDGSFTISGLPDPDETFLMFDLKELVTTTSDLNQLKLPHGKSINLPNKFKNVSNYRYTGNFTGFFKDFVTYGKLETNLGVLYTDLLFSPDSLNQIRFDGQLRTTNFSIGELLGNQDKIGTISLDSEISGKGTVDKGFLMDIDGEIYKFEINNYPYRGIQVKGRLADNLFNGDIIMDDPNAQVEFNGKIDLSTEKRIYAFTANVIRANLYNLNIHKKDSNYTATFLVKANLSGNSLNEINGEVRLLNSLFVKSNSQIQLYDLTLNIVNNDLTNKIDLRSNLFDLKVDGHYKITDLSLDFLCMANQILPSLGLLRGKTIDENYLQTYSFELRLKQHQSLWQFFFPDYQLENNSYFSGKFTRSNDVSFNLHAEIPNIKFKKSEFNSLFLNAVVDDSLMNFEAGGVNLNLNKRVNLENFTINCNGYNDHLNYSARWINWDSTLYKGNINGSADFSADTSNQNLQSRIQLLASEITISDTTWKIQPFSINIDSSGFVVENAKIYNNNEYFKLNGRLSNIPGDSLILEFNDFNLDNISFLTRSKSFKFAGILYGEALITGTKNNPVFFSNIIADSLVINNQFLGNCKMYSAWNPDKEAIYINAYAMRGLIKTLSLTGNYYPSKNNLLELSLNFDRFRLGFVSPYLAGAFENIKGLATGGLSIEGTLQKPSLNGRLKFQETYFTIDYLKTRYHFTSDINFVNNNVVFDNVKLYDTKDNSAMVNGLISSEYLKNFKLNLNIQANNLLCLNTSSKDNPDYYGNAYVTGLIRLTGKPRNMMVDVNAHTGPNTRFYIPLSGEGTVSEYNYITFFKSDTTGLKENEEDEYRVDLSGMQLNFDLSVTPDAEVQIIFDSKMGDIIRARGTGEFKIAINTLGDFRMVGEYIIEKGDYLFTLQDVINKKFKVESGSSLRWSGDPVNANIDIVAFYRTKASLSDLLGSTEQASSRTTVDCKLNLSGQLIKPKIRYELYLPYVEQSIRDRAASKLTSEEEISKQFLSLLVLNRFYYDPTTGVAEDENSSDANIAGVNASELLSNQLSNWLSQISNDFDIGVNYRPGSKITSDEVEVALSTQLLNDRLSINGSVDMKTNAEVNNTNTIVGDVDIDYKINPKGNLRVRAFNRANDDIVVNYSPYTQGLGVYYVEEFDTLGEVLNKYMAFFNGERKKKKKEGDKASNADQDSPVENNAEDSEDN